MCVGMGIRFFRIAESPASVNWDEAALGYNAYSLAHTGRDEFGKALPVSLRSFDDYKPAAYAYFSVPIVKIWGLSETTTRATSAIMGTLTAFLVMYIAAKLSGRMSLGWLSAIICMTAPWSMHFSRIAFESNVATTLYYLGIALVVLARKYKPAFPAALMVMVISMYTYHAQRAIAIPTLLTLTWIFKKELWPYIASNFRRLTILFALMLTPLLMSFVSEPAGSRLSATIIFKQWPFVPSELNMLVFNPLYTGLWQFVGQFLAYFSPANIFFRGSNEPILRIPGLGLMFPETIILWLVGLCMLPKYRFLKKVVLVIFALAPLPGAITWNWFSVVRTVAIYPAFAIISGFGAICLWEAVRRKIIRIFLAGGYTIVLALSFWYAFLTISLYAPWENYGEFQPGFEEMVPYVLDKSRNYSEVVVDTGQTAPYIFFLFYSQYPPAQYQTEARRDLKHSEIHGYQFGKFVFRKIADYEMGKTGKMLVGQTLKLPEYEIKEIQKSRDIRYKDFFDKAGYVSVRVVEL